jgi:hypothetical protein
VYLSEFGRNTGTGTHTELTEITMARISHRGGGDSLPPNGKEVHTEVTEIRERYKLRREISRTGSKKGE